MAGKKISELDGVDLGAFTGNELIEMVQGGVNVKMTFGEFATMLGGGSALPPTSDGHPFDILQIGGDNEPFWGNVLHDNHGVDVLDLRTRYLSDENGNLAIDIGARQMTDDNGNAFMSFKSGQRILADDYGRQSIDVGLRALTDDSSTVSMNWIDRKLYDGNGQLVYDWGSQEYV